MKTSALKAKLRSLALSEMPEVIDKINLDNIVILPRLEKEPRVVMNLRRVMAYTFTLLFVGVLSIGGYTLFTQGTSSLTPLETDSEVLAFQAISASSLLTEIDATQLSYNVIPYSSDTSVLVDDDIDLVNQYLNMMETVLGEQDTMLTQSLTSDREEYTSYVLFRNQDCLGNLIEYKFYYNAEEIDGQTRILGILLHEDKEYTIESSYTGSALNNTQTLKASVDESNYVLIETLNSDTEQTYQYKYYLNTQLQNQATITIQMKKGKLKATIETFGTSELILQVEKGSGSTSGSLQVDFVKMMGGTSQEGHFSVDVELDSTSGKYQYKYKTDNNGMQDDMTGERANKGNTKATDDDFTPMGNGDSHGSLMTTSVTTSTQTNTNSSQATTTTMHSMMPTTTTNTNGNASTTQTTTSSTNGTANTTQTTTSSTNGTANNTQTTTSNTNSNPH